jgi:hypothetical protein
MLLTHLPIPPTSNRFLIPANGRLIKSPEARRYEGTMHIYALRFFKQIEAIAEAFKGKHLRVDRYFIFHKSRLITKKDTLKKLDSSNRVKILDDSVSKLIGIDDCYFITGVAEKLWCDDPKDEQVILKFSEYSLKEFKAVGDL